MLESLPKINETITASKNSNSMNLTEGETAAVQYTAKVSSIAGSGVTFKIIPQFSYDNKEWHDCEEASHSDELTENSTFPFKQTKLAHQVGVRTRFRFEVSGTNPEIALELWAVGRKTTLIGGAGASPIPIEEANQASPENKESFEIDAAGTTFGEILDLEKVAANNLEATLDVTELTGGDTTLDVIPQYSHDGIKFFDQPTDLQFDEVSILTALPFSQSLELEFVPRYARFKLVVAGATPHTVFDLYYLAKR